MTHYFLLLVSPPAVQRGQTEQLLKEDSDDALISSGGAHAVNGDPISSHFCSAGCKAAFEKAPAKYVKS